MSLAELQEIPDIGPKVGQSIYDWFREEKNLKLLSKLEAVGIKIKAERRQSNKLENLVFVLTGSLQSLTRAEAKKRIRDQGGDVNESVSKKTDYVIVGSQPGSKYDQAQRLNIKTLTEPEFIQLIN